MESMHRSDWRVHIDTNLDCISFRLQNSPRETGAYINTVGGIAASI